jgi:hypothetical protein
MYICIPLMNRIILTSFLGKLQAAYANKFLHCNVENMCTAVN